MHYLAVVLRWRLVVYNTHKLHNNSTMMNFILRSTGCWQTVSGKGSNSSSFIGRW